MKQILSLAIFLVFICQNSFAQTYNWGRNMDATQHIVGAQVGWAYAAVVGINYGYKLETEKPIFLQAGFSIPFGSTVLDDYRTHIGASGLLFNKNNFNSIVTINGLHRRYASELVVLNNLGFELKTTNGFYKSKWFVATEIGLELGLPTHIKHSDTYRQNIYAEVADGWYKPVSGAIMNIGVQGGYTFNKSDLIFTIGIFQSVSSTVNVLIPYYTTLGYNINLD
jgi:hypothetical protein